jgi:hypothetical protein
MPQNFTPKQQTFLNTWVTQLLQFLNDADELGVLNNEWTANAFATGANPTSNNITDAVVQGPYPAATALVLNEAVGAVVAIQATIAANRGYLEAMRP